MAVPTGRTKSILGNAPTPHMHIDFTITRQCQQPTHHVHVPILTCKNEASLGPAIEPSMHIHFPITCQS